MKKLLLCSLALSFACDPSVLMRKKDKNDKATKAITEKAETSPEVPKEFFLKNEKGAYILKSELRNLGRIAQKLDLSIRRVSGLYNDFHLDSGSKTQLTISDFKGHVSLKVLSPDFTNQQGINMGMDFAALRNIEPALKCEANNDAAGTDIRCKLANGFVAVFPLDAKKFASKKLPSTVDEFEKVLGSAKILRLEAELKGIEKSKSPTARVRQKGVLPAGVSYFRSAYTPCTNSRWSSATCDVPSVAVVDGIYSEQDARQRLNSIGVGAQYPVGYPLVVHSDEIGFIDGKTKGVAIVLGLFANGNAAKIWQEKVAPKATVMTLLPPGPKGPSVSRSQQVVRIRPGSSVGGFKIGAFESADLKAKMPDEICKVKGGSFVVVDQKFAYDGSPIPAKCKDGKDTFVRYDDTLLHAMIGPDRSSKWKAWQLSQVECDTGYFSSWPMDGRTIGEKKTALMNDGGC